jgi:hypothetical protein
VGRNQSGGQRGGVAIAVGVFVGALSLPGLASSQAPVEPAGGEAPRVLVATTGNQSERFRTLPITRRDGQEKRVAMSMKPQRLPTLRKRDRLKTTAEIQFTVNCYNNGFARCVGPAYKYNPIIRAKLVLARHKNTKGGPGAVRISPYKREVCRQRLPFREHHCVITFTRAEHRVGDPSHTPCPPDSCRVNLVVDAHNPKARDGDKLMVGGQQPDGSIPQDRGRINAIRFRPGDQPKVPAAKTKRRVSKRVDPDFRKHVVYSHKLTDLEAGEQLEVSAKMHTDISHLPYNTRTSAHLVLAARRRATRSNRPVARVATLGGEIAELNGFNCTRNRPTCTFRKVGVLQIERDADRALFVNLVTILGPKRSGAAPAHRVNVTGRGHLRVVRYPAEMRG